MNFLKTTDIGGFPAYLDDFRWAESGYVDQILSMLKAFKPRDIASLQGYGAAPANDFIIWGCEVSGGSGVYEWTEGAVFIDGEIHSVDASTAPVSVSVFTEALVFNPTVIWAAAGNKLFQSGPPAKDTYGIRKATVDIEPIATSKLGLFFGDRYMRGYSSADPFWTPVSAYINPNWQHFDAGTPVSWKVNEFGEVAFRGVAKRIANGSGYMFSLPPRARPAVERTFPIFDYNAGSAAGCIRVEPGGLVGMWWAVPINGQFDLSIIRYRAGE